MFLNQRHAWFPCDEEGTHSHRFPVPRWMIMTAIILGACDPPHEDIAAESAKSTRDDDTEAAAASSAASAREKPEPKPPGAEGVARDAAEAKSAPEYQKDKLQAKEAEQTEEGSSPTVAAPAPKASPAKTSKPCTDDREGCVRHFPELGEVMMRE